MTFDVIPGEHMSVAIAMQRLEAAYPALPDQRSRYPLFFDVGALDSSSGCPEAVASSWLARRFEALMKLAIGPSQAAERSWHSWRVTLACALRAAVDAEHPDGRGLDVIKLFGRWRSDSAVKLYARMTPDAYAKHVSASLRADASRLSGEDTAEAMHNVDPMAFIGELESIASAQDDPGSSKVPQPQEPAQPIPKPKRKPSRQSAKPSARRAKRGASGAEAGSTAYVMVPASLFPEETCEENGGEGWTATTSPHRKGTLKVTFTHAKDEDGMPFAPVYLQSACMVPLPHPAAGGGHAQGGNATPRPSGCQRQAQRDWARGHQGCPPP